MTLMEATFLFKRCEWATKHPSLIAYHDIEWGVPKTTSVELFEALSLEILQAGLHWPFILSRREAFRSAFYGFEPQLVGKMDDAAIEELMQQGPLKNRRKIEAIVANAQIVVQLAKAGQSFHTFCWQPVYGEPLDLLNDGQADHHEVAARVGEKWVVLFKRAGFKRIGTKTMVSFLQASGIVNDHRLGCFRREQIQQSEYLDKD